MQRIDFSAVVPVYRGRETIDELCSRLIEFFTARGCTFEIILVDDGSTDGSWQRIQAIAANEPRVLGVRLTRNFGQHNATICGFRHANGEMIVTLDEDLQNPPEQIGKLADCQARENADVVYGIPESRRDSRLRRIGSRLAMLIPRHVMNVNFDISAFRLLRAPIAREISRALRHDIIIDVCCAWVTDRIVATRVEHVESSRRESSYTLLKLARVLFNMLYNYTVLPLRFSILVGGALSGVSMLFAGYFIYVRFTQEVGVPGFSALIVSVLFSTGVILLGIGLMSEYLAHTFLHVIRKPQSVIRETTSGSPASDS